MKNKDLNFSKVSQDFRSKFVTVTQIPNKLFFGGWIDKSPQNFLANHLVPPEYRGPPTFFFKIPGPPMKNDVFKKSGPARIMGGGVIPWSFNAINASKSWGLRLWSRFYTWTFVTSNFSILTFLILDFSNFDFHSLFELFILRYAIFY